MNTPGTLNYTMCDAHALMPPIGVSYGRAGMIGLWRRVPADSRHFMLSAGVAVPLHQGGPEESVAGGLQADSGHGARRIHW